MRPALINYLGSGLMLVQVLVALKLRVLLSMYLCKLYCKLENGNGKNTDAILQYSAETIHSLYVQYCMYCTSQTNAVLQQRFYEYLFIQNYQLEH